MATEHGDNLKAVQDLLESQCPSDGEQASTVEALREALDDMRAGDTGIPARKFLAELRRKYHLPTRS
jgi:hypothetical protein